MALKDDIAVLSEVPVFAGMGEEEIRLLAFGAEKRVLSKDQTLFRQGAPADCAFVVLRGQIALNSESGTGGHIADAGTLISELAMISQVERKYTAVAMDDSEVIRINRALFLRLLEEFPEAAAAVEARIRENLGALLKGITGQHHRFA